jgi:hypothetical protein
VSRALRGLTLAVLAMAVAVVVRQLLARRDAAAALEPPGPPTWPSFDKPLDERVEPFEQVSPAAAMHLAEAVPADPAPQQP